MADYISKVKLPGDTKIYEIKDAWARDVIRELNDFTAYLGVTTTALTDGATTNPIKINGADVTAEAGDIVTLNSGEDLYTATDFIFNGTIWQKFGNNSKLGKLAYKDSATSTDTFVKTNTSTNITYATSVSSVTQPTVTVTPTTAAIKTSVPKDTWVTGVSYHNVTGATYNAVTGVSYSKATGGTATVNTSATFTGAIPANTYVTGVTGGTGTKNTATSLGLYSVTTGGTPLVTAIPSTATVAGSVTVGSEDVYGLAGSTTKYMTGPESLSKVSATVLTSVTATKNANAWTAAVTDEILTFNSTAGTVTTTTAGSTKVLSETTTITAGTAATATKYTVGKDGSYSLTGGTATISNPTTVQYKVSVPANTWVASVTAASGTKNSAALTITTSGSAVTDGAITITNEDAAADVTTSATAASLTASTAAATLTKNAATTLAIQAATGGYTVATGISSATATAPTVTLKTSTTKVLTGNTTGTVTVS